MTKTDKWNKVFSNQDVAATTACKVLRENLHLLPLQGDALDYASGLGANALLLAKQNLRTHAWDLSPVALNKLVKFANAQGLHVQIEVRNVEQFPPDKSTFDVIVASNFLHRPTFHDLIYALKDQGILFYQTFTQAKAQQIGPSNPNYLLGTNELLTLCSSLEVLVYREEGLQGYTKHGWRNQAMVVARKTSKANSFQEERS